ncbi:MAG: HNH endonuclease [Myxococcales bacterium]
MIKANLAIEVMNDDDLLACTRELVRNSCEMEAELLLHLAEIDERKLYAQRAYPSMHVFCVKELGFSDGAAYNRLGVAKAGRRWPAVLDALRSGAVHLSGLRVLVPHFTDENLQRLLAEAAGKSKREIEEMAARLSPKAPVPDRVWRLPQRSTQSLFEPVARTQSSADPTASPGPAVPVSRQQEHRSIVAPLAEDIFEVRFTAPRELRDKLRQAQDLLRHRTPSGALAVVFDKALDALIVNLKKERFAVGRKPRNPAAPTESTSWSRDVPDAIKRAVYERAQGCCEFVGDEGRRCSETGGLELDHIDGFARTHVHSVEGIRLLCHVHNLLAAEQMYGRAFLDRVRRELAEARASAARKTPLSSPPVGARPGAKGQRSLF